MSAVYVQFLSICVSAENTDQVYEGLALFEKERFHEGNAYFQKLINRDLFLEEGVDIETMSRADKSIRMDLQFSQTCFYETFDHFIKAISKAGAYLIYIAVADSSTGFDEKRGYRNGRKVRINKLSSEMAEYDINIALQLFVQAEDDKRAIGALEKGADPDVEVNGLPAIVYVSFYYEGNKKVRLVEALLSAGADPNAEYIGKDRDGDEYNGYRPLHLAMLSTPGKPKHIEKLIRCGAEVTTKSDQGITPLHLAGKYASWKRYAQILTRAGADINAGDDLGRTPLMHLFIRSELGADEQHRAFLFYIALGADTMSKDNHGGNVLWYAAQNEHCELHLRESGLCHTTPANAYGGDAEANLYQAIRHHDDNAFSAFMDALPALSDDLGYEMVQFCIRYNRLEYLKQLVGKGLNINYKSDGQWHRVPLIFAEEHGRDEIVAYIERVGALRYYKKEDYDIGPDLEKALLDAIEAQDVGKVIFLIEHGASPSPPADSDYKPEVTPLTWAAKQGNLDIVRYLVSQGADVNQIDNSGFTPLIRGVESLSLDIVRFLGEKGADINTVVEDNLFHQKTNAFYRAITHGTEEISLFLLGSGIDVTGCPGLSENYLVEAASKGRANLVRALVEAGMDINMKDGHGGTALMSASAGHNFELVKYLVENGASYDYKPSGAHGHFFWARDKKIKNYLLKKFVEK